MRPLGNLPMWGRGKVALQGRSKVRAKNKVGARLGQGWDKAGASRIEPKCPNVGQKHWARPSNLAPSMLRPCIGRLPSSRAILKTVCFHIDLAGHRHQTVGTHSWEQNRNIQNLLRVGLGTTFLLMKTMEQMDGFPTSSHHNLTNSLTHCHYQNRNQNRNRNQNQNQNQNHGYLGDGITKQISLIV